MSDDIFVIRNDLGQFWTRQGEWVDGREPQRLMKIKHHDEAVNQLVELSAKDIELRGEVLPVSLNDKGEPDVEVSEHPTQTLAEKAAAQKLLEEAANDEANEAANEAEQRDEPESIAAV